MQHTPLLVQSDKSMRVSVSAAQQSDEHMVPGEKFEFKHSLKEVSNNLQFGDIWLSNYKLIFKPNGCADYARYQVPYGNIAKISSKPNGDNAGTITIQCKDERVLKFKIETQAFHHIAKIINKYHTQASFAYLWQADIMMRNKIVQRIVQDDFDRLGFTSSDRFQKFTSVSQEFEHTFQVESSLSDNQKTAIQKVRHFGLIPTACYQHKNGSLLFRGSEPRIQFETCLPDLILHQMMAKPFPILHVFSSRPEPSLKYHTEAQSYPIIKHYYNIDYNKVQESYSQMCQVVAKDFTRQEFDESFVSKIHKTEWVLLCQTVLTNAVKVATLVNQGVANVLVYCGSGTQVSQVLVSLVELILDPHYRTFDGFQTLMYREWHNNFYCDFKDATFYLFLDAVHSLCQMNVTSFEFTTDWLAWLAQEVTTNRFFEFVAGFKESQSLPSVFSKEFRQSNCLYRPGSPMLAFNPQYVQYWDQFFQHYQYRPVTAKHEAISRLLKIKEQILNQKIDEPVNSIVINFKY